jgi:hypothetical protein
MEAKVLRLRLHIVTRGERYSWRWRIESYSKLEVEAAGGGWSLHVGVGGYRRRMEARGRGWRHKIC